MTIHMNTTAALALLGLPDSATKQEIDKAYRQLVRQKHPDKNNGTEGANIRDVNKAYDYLKKICIADTNKKNDKFQQLPPNNFELKLTLEEISQGGSKVQTITRKVINKITGKEEKEEVQVQVSFDPGVLTGNKIILPEQGDQQKGKIAANAVFLVVELTHPHFKRRRMNLEYTAELNPEEALLGQVWIPRLNYTDFFKYEHGRPITSSTIKTIEDWGLPYPPDGAMSNQNGAMYLRFKIFDKSDPPINKDLLLTLEQIRSGFTKILKIQRLVIDSNGEKVEEEEELSIKVDPGTPEGTEFVFERKGNRLQTDTLPADIIFTLRYKSHLKFKVNGLDIEYLIELTSNSEQTRIFEVPTLDENETLKLETIEPITNDTVKSYPGYGLPSEGEPKIYGNLIVKFKVVTDYPIDPPIKRNLFLTLESIFTGYKKEIKIIQKVFDENQNETLEEKFVTIEVKPGTKSGTEFKIPDLCNKNHGSMAGDFIFVARDKPHSLFKRIGADIEYVAEYSKYDLQIGTKLEILTLDNGENISIDLNEIVSPESFVKRFAGRGLPYLDKPNKRGNLFVRFKEIKIKQDPPVVRELYLTSEQMRKGTAVIIKFDSTITDQQGSETVERKEFNIVIEPNTKVDTRIPFPQAGDHKYGRLPADIIYVIKQNH